MAHRTFLFIVACMVALASAQCPNLRGGQPAHDYSQAARPANGDPNAPPKDVDCLVREEALTYASKILNGRPGIQDVYDALAAAECSLPRAVAGRDKRLLTPSRSSAQERYVSPSGDDSASGSPSAPWKTLGRAVQFIGSSERNVHTATTVFVDAGVYFLAKPLRFTLAESGSPQAPILFRPLRNGSSRPVISGGTPLRLKWDQQTGPGVNTSLINTNNIAGDIHGPGLNSTTVIYLGTTTSWQVCSQLSLTKGGKSWTWHDSRVGQGFGLMCYMRTDNVWAPSGQSDHWSGQVGAGKTVWSADIDSTSPFYTQPIRSLVVNNTRQWRARFPNGNPMDYCSSSAVECPQRLKTDSKRPTHGSNDGISATPTNTKIICSASGKTISEGSLTPLADTHTLNVSVPSSHWYDHQPTCGDYASWSGGALDRYDQTYAKPFWKSSVPQSFYYTPATMSPRIGHWSNVNQSVVHMFHPGFWGGWAFEVDSVDVSNQEIHIPLGGFQEARGGGITGNYYYIENIIEELDDEHEFYHDVANHKLYYIAPKGTEMYSAEVVVPVLEQLVEITGSSATAPVSSVTFDSFVFTHTTSTFLGPYEVPSGGDWAIHRGAAVFISNATDVHLTSSLFTLLDGNAVFLSQYTRRCVITQSEFFSIGESCVALVGSAVLMDARAGTQPVYTTVSRNHFHNWGIWGKQTSAVFQSVSHHNTIQFNIGYNGPRAGINVNDGLGGGSLIQGNLIFNTVLETGDHGVFNSWDRQAYIWINDTTKEVQFVPDTWVLAHNFFFRNSYMGNTANLYTIDNDDGSSRFLHEHNVLVQGGIKYRDGIDRTSQGNLILYPTVMPYGVAFQVNGFDTDVYSNNTLVTATGQAYGACASLKTTDAHESGIVTAHNTYVTPNNTALPFSSGGCGGSAVTDWDAWQKLGWEVNSMRNADASLATLRSEIRARLLSPST